MGDSWRFGSDWGQGGGRAPQFFSTGAPTRVRASSGICALHFGRSLSGAAGAREPLLLQDGPSPPGAKQPRVLRLPREGARNVLPATWRGLRERTAATRSRCRTGAGELEPLGYAG